MAQKGELNLHGAPQLGSTDESYGQSSREGRVISATQLPADQAGVSGNVLMSGAYLSGAHHLNISEAGFYNFQGNQSVVVHINGGYPKTAGSKKEITLNVLICPAPAQYFVGRRDILSQLSRLFSPPVVTLYSSKQEELEKFIKDHINWCSTINLDASSLEGLHRAWAEKVKGSQLSSDTIIVLKNADPSLALEEHFPEWLYIPVLITCHIRQEIPTKVPEETFQLSDSADQKEIKELVRAIKPILQGRQKVVTVVSSGGTGKSQVAFKFVAENSSRFSNIWFFDASSDITLAEDFKKLGKAAGVGEEVETVRAFLASTQQNWLCIFDNADNKKVLLKNYIPICNHGNIIVTSRLKETEQLTAPSHHIALGDLHNNHAIELLLKHAHEESSERNINVAHSIVDAVGCQALAVSTAGAYIQANPTCGLGDYLSRFERERKKLLDYRIKSLDRYSETVLSAFMLAFERLSEPAQILIQICSFFHPTVIPLEIFIYAVSFSASEFLETEENILGREEMEQFVSLFKEDGLLQSSIDEMCQLSLASYNYSGKYLTFHSVIHNCAHETALQQTGLGMGAALLLARATPLGKTKEAYSFRKQLLVHANHIQWENLSSIYARICMAEIFAGAAYWPQVERLEEQALSVRAQLFGEQHPVTLGTMLDLATAYWHSGKLEEAEKLEEKVLLLRKQEIGEEHPDTLKAMTSLAATYRVRGKLQEAEELEEKVLLLRKRVSGDYNSDILNAMANLSATYRNRGKLEEAEKLGEEVVLLCKQVFGELHPDTLTCMANLATTYRSCGKLEEAEKLAEEVVSLRKLVNGDHHSDTLKSMTNLAATYKSRRKLQKAETLQEETLSLYKQAIGECDPSTLVCMVNLATTYRDRVKLREAEKLGEEVLQLHKQVFGERDPDTLISMTNLAATYWECGKLQRAEVLQKEVLLLSKEVIGKDPPDTLNCMTNLAITYRSRGKLQDAEKLEEEVQSLKDKTQ